MLIPSTVCGTESFSQVNAPVSVVRLDRASYTSSECFFYSLSRAHHAEALKPARTHTVRRTDVSCCRRYHPLLTRVYAILHVHLVVMSPLAQSNSPTCRMWRILCP